MIRLIWILILWLVWISCDDEIPYELVQPQAGQQKVLVEEISGVRCPNCPDGSRLLEALNADFDSSLIVVTYHAGSFSIPYPESKYDFKTDQSVALMEMLGRPLGYPAAAIQRKPVPGENTFQRYSNTWTKVISEVLSSDPKVDLELEVVTAENEVVVRVSALFLESLTQPVFLTMYLTENGLIDPQADTRAGDEFVPDFVHNHVLRAILTPLTGQLWGNGFEALDLKRDSLLFSFDNFPGVADPSKSDVVAFLHTNEGVLQVEKAKAFPR